MDSDRLIENISDTALWVAYYRAMETARKDSIFQDHLAKKLAGTKGENIVNNMKGGKSSAWWLIVRTKALDEMITRVVGSGRVDAVLNLAAGLDTRPYRLPVPQGLWWYEADLPGILDYKESILGGASLRCNLERFRCDLSKADARKELFSTIASRTKKCLVITEGLLVYLDKELVADLATDLYSISSFHYWLLDYTTEVVLEMIRKRWDKMLKDGNSPMKFTPPGGPAFFEEFGWKKEELRWAMAEAVRLKREMPFGPLMRTFSFLMPKAKREMYEKSSGFLMLKR